jgi:outer membrane protein OmpA-like peptidoglycan-associated protein
MRNHIILFATAVFLSACAAAALNVDRDELADARAAIEAARAADAERCAPRLMAQAVATLYSAAHELAEDVHLTEAAELIASAEAMGDKARKQAIENCKPKPAPKPVVVEIITLKGVNFDFDSAELTPASVSILDKAVATLKRRGDINVEIAAHTDSRGSNAYNFTLSKKRAASVMDYLVGRGIRSLRLVPRGYGETQPVASNDTDEGRAKNRRVELRILN